MCDREAVAVIKGAKKKKGRQTDVSAKETPPLPRETVSGERERESWAQAKGPVVSSGHKRRKGGRGVGKFVHPPISSSTPSLFLLPFVLYPSPLFFPTCHSRLGVGRKRRQRRPPLLLSTSSLPRFLHFPPKLLQPGSSFPSSPLILFLLFPGSVQ